MIPAEDRKELAKSMTGKLSKWPRTERRAHRIRQTLERRQPDLSIVLENVHDLHNVSAVLRSCDAVGILRVHTIYTHEQRPAKAFARTTSAGAAKWIEVVHHESVAACYAALHADGFAIWATSLRQGSVELYDLDLRNPVAVVFGNEMRGVSEEAADAADGTLVIPMQGMIESLNISVACAVTLFEAMRQRQAAGAYDAPKLPVARLSVLSEEWLRR